MKQVYTSCSYQSLLMKIHFFESSYSSLSSSSVTHSRVPFGNVTRGILKVVLSRFISLLVSTMIDIAWKEERSHLTEYYAKLPVNTYEIARWLASTTFSRLFFSAWPGSGVPLSRYLEGVLYKFWLTDWLIQERDLHHSAYSPTILRLWSM